MGVARQRGDARELGAGLDVVDHVDAAAQRLQAAHGFGARGRRVAAVAIEEVVAGDIEIFVLGGAAMGDAVRVGAGGRPRRLRPGPRCSQGSAGAASASRPIKTRKPGRRQAMKGMEVSGTVSGAF